MNLLSILFSKSFINRDCFFLSCIFQAEKEINEIVWKVGKLKRQREECHEKLGGVKSTRSFVMQAATFWDEVVNLTKTATVKTEHIQRILELAARKNSVRILTSKGTQIKVASFKEHWMEVAEMISSGVNNRLFNGKVLLHLSQ